MNGLRFVSTWLVTIVLCVIMMASNVVSATAQDVLPPSDKATLEFMAGQMLLVGFRGVEVDENHHIYRDIAEHHLGGVILFNYDVRKKSYERNIVSPEQVARLTNQLQTITEIPLFISVDQEGGRVARFRTKNGFPEFPSAQKLGAGTADETFAAGDAIGEMLQGLGVNVDFAPVLDVAVDPKSPAIGALERSFSPNADAVAVHGRAFRNGLNAHGIVAALKHFPGHGSANMDSHKGVTDVTETWLPEELIPYRKLLPDAAMQMVMVGHMVNRSWDADLPATLSSKVISGMLRAELGWDGVVVTDDMQMGAIVREYGRDEAVLKTIQAGSDIVLFGNNLEYDADVVPHIIQRIQDWVEQGLLTRERIAKSYERVRKLKLQML